MEFECDKCGEKFNDGIDAGHHEISHNYEWVEVYLVIDGGIEETKEFNTRFHAEEYALQTAKELEINEGLTSDWEIYILPHYCDRHSEDECMCSQWLTDHSPLYSSEDK